MDVRTSSIGFRRALVLGAMILLCAIAAFAQAEEALVKIGGAEVRRITDLAYGSDALQRMDVYLPAKPNAAPAPIILMVHGGAWAYGDKATDRVVANKVARWVPRGFIFVSVNYPMVPEANPVQQADHIARAIAATQEAATGWGGDGSRIILMGHSAGAHLVSLLNADPAHAEELGARPWLGAISLDSGALDVPVIMNHAHDKLYDKAFGADAELWQASSPMHRLTKAAKPWLGICSSLRSAACAANTDFALKSRSLGLRAEVLGQKLRHIAINSELGKPGAYTDAVEAFMASLDPRVKELLGR